MLRRPILVVLAMGLCLPVSCQLARSEHERAFFPLTLRPELERYLEEHFPTCQVVTGEDYDSEDLRLFAPTWRVTGDFDGNGEQDVCLLMKCPGQGSSLVIAVHRTTGGVKHFVLDRNLCHGRIGTALHTEGPGLVRASMADEVEKLKGLSNPGIVVSVLETCDERLYYWEDDRYESVYRGL